MAKANVKKTALKIGDRWISACFLPAYRRSGTDEKMYLTSDYAPNSDYARRRMGNTRGTAEYLSVIRDMLNFYPSRAEATRSARCPTNYATVSTEDRREGRFDARRSRRR